jgi:hypothetical protein
LQRRRGPIDSRRSAAAARTQDIDKVPEEALEDPASEIRESRGLVPALGG